MGTGSPLLCMIMIAPRMACMECKTSSVSLPQAQAYSWQSVVASSSGNIFWASRFQDTVDGLQIWRCPKQATLHLKARVRLRNLDLGAMGFIGTIMGMYRVFPNRVTTQQEVAKRQGGRATLEAGRDQEECTFDYWLPVGNIGIYQYIIQGLYRDHILILPTEDHFGGCRQCWHSSIFLRGPGADDSRLQRSVMRVASQTDIKRWDFIPRYRGRLELP